MAGQTVIVSVLADTRRFNTAMGGTDATLRRFSNSLRRVNTVGIAVFTSLAIVVGRFTLDAINAADAAGVIDARLANTAKQMRLFGKETDNVVNSLRDFATEQQQILAIDDDLIKQTQTVLLTFKNLAKTADEVGGAFEQATVLAFDLASTFGGDGVTNAKLLGIALNDPIAGVGRLTRVGVQFNATQKAQIAAFVETNQLAKAQRIILNELQRQVGGNAEAGASAAQQLRTSFGNLQEVFGENILGEFSEEIQLLADELYKFTQTEEFTEFALSLGTAIEELAKELPGLLVDFGKFLKLLNDNDISIIDITKSFIAFNVVVGTLLATISPLFAVFQFFNSRGALKKQAADQDLLTRRTAAYNDIVDDLTGRLNQQVTAQKDAQAELDNLSKKYPILQQRLPAVNQEFIKLNNQYSEAIYLQGELAEELEDVKKQWREGTLNLKGFNAEAEKTDGVLKKLFTSLKPVAVTFSRVFAVIGAITAIIPFLIGLFKGLGEGIEEAFAGRNLTVQALFGGLIELGTGINTVLSDILNVDDAFKNFWDSLTEIWNGLDDISEGFYQFFEGIGAALGRFIIDPLKEWLALLEEIENFWNNNPGGRGNQDRFGGINPSSAPSPAPSPSALPAGLVVNVSALAPSPEIGRQVVAAISDYERTSGRRFA